MLFHSVKTNDWVRSKINFPVGPQAPLLATAKRQKLASFGHVTRHDSLSKTIRQGTLEGRRRRGRQRKCPIYNIEWTFLPMPELLTRVSSRKDWKRVSAESSFMSLQQENEVSCRLVQVTMIHGDAVYSPFNTDQATTLSDARRGCSGQS